MIDQASEVRTAGVIAAVLCLVLLTARPSAALAATADAGSDETTALGRPVVLDGSASVADPGATYAWDFGDGETTSFADSTASHNYRFAGSYTATLTVTDGGGASTDTATASVEMSATNIDYSKFPVDRTDYLTETASTRYVSLSGSDANDGAKSNPYRTIQYAISQATSGTVILVRGGHYFAGDITIDKSSLVLAAYPGEKVVIETDAYNVWEHRNGIALVGPIENVVLDGLDIRRFTTQGVQFGDENTQRNVILKNLVIDGAETGINTVYIGGTPAQPFIDGLLVSDVTMQHVSLMGFNAGAVGGGVQLYRNVHLDRVYALMSGTGDNTAADAMAFENGQNVLAENSIAQDAGGDGFDFKADKTAVVNSIARRITRNGVKLWSNGQIVNSLVYDTGADAGVVLEDGDFRIVNSAFAWHLKGQSGGAYSMTAGYDNPSFDSLEIFRSIFFEECDRFYVNDTGPGSLSVKENVFHDFALDRILQYGGTDYETTAAINAQTWGEANADRDPGFAAPASDDWRIPTGSNGFVAPELEPPPVVTISSPAYLSPAGPRRSIRFSVDQTGTYSLESTRNAVPGSGVAVRTGSVQKGTVYSLGVPATVPSWLRLYLFVTNSAGKTGWQWARVDTYRPRAYAPRYASIRRYGLGRLYYRVVDPYSSRAYVTIVIRNSRGKYVSRLPLGWQPTGSTRYRSIRPRLARGRYLFLVYATDLAYNSQSLLGRNVLIVR